MTITAIKDVGSEIIASVKRNSELECLAHDMRNAVKYYEDAGKYIPEIEFPSRELAVQLCIRYSKQSYNNPSAKERDIKFAFTFWNRMNGNSKPM